MIAICYEQKSHIIRMHKIMWIRIMYRFGRIRMYLCVFDYIIEWLVGGVISLVRHTNHFE